MDEQKASTGIAVARMTAVLGMAITVTLGILLLLGGWLLPGGLALLAFVPFLLLMRYLERHPGDED